MFEQLFLKKDSVQYEIRILLMRISAVKKLTYNDLAQEIGVSGGTINRFLGKEIDVRKRTLSKMIEYIDLEKERIGL